VVQHVDEEADDEHDDRDQQHGALDLLEVAHADVAHEHLADAGEVEHPLDDDDPGDQAGDLHAEDRDDRQRGVAQPVPPQRLRSGQPLRSRRADVLLVQDVERGRAHEPQQHGRLRQRQRDRRQDQGLGRRPRLGPALAREALRRQPPPARSDDGRQHQPDPERRDRDAELTDGRHGDPVGAPVAGGGEDPEWDGDDDRHDGRRQHERCRDRQLLAELARDRRLVQRRLPEVALDDATDPLDVLVPQGAVQPQLLAEGGDALRGCLRAGDHSRQVAGQEAQQDEHEHARDGDRHHEQGEASEHEQSHRRSVSRIAEDRRRLRDQPATTMSEASKREAVSLIG
jgi:hypothetical protein